MKVYKLNQDNGITITHYDSKFMLFNVAKTDGSTTMNYVHLDKKGVIGYHQAAMPQLLIVISGEGSVCSEQMNYYKVQSGDAVLWERGEWHETRTENGLTAFVIESEQMETDHQQIFEFRS